MCSVLLLLQFSYDAGATHKAMLSIADATH